jgi:hypothetical protein
MKIFLTGHGGWTPKNGYFSVPAGTSVTFYTENAKLMLSTDVYKIVEGTWTHPASSVVGAYKSCQNMTLYPDDKEYVNKTLSALMKNPNRDQCDVVRVTSPLNLKDIVEKHPGNEFVWACCRDLSLSPSALDKNLGGGKTLQGSTLARDSGINAGQSGSRTINFDKKTWNWA